MRCIEKRGQITNQTYLTTERVELYDMPLAEIVLFYDRLKTVSKGYASFDYTPIGMRTSSLVKSILLNATIVDALSSLMHTDNAYSIGKKMCEKLKELIPRQQFDIPVQAAIGVKLYLVKRCAS
jgi:GTP-binding protein LepA